MRLAGKPTQNSRAESISARATALNFRVFAAIVGDLTA